MNIKYLENYVKVFQIAKECSEHIKSTGKTNIEFYTDEDTVTDFPFIDIYMVDDNGRPCGSLCDVCINSNGEIGRAHV